jgi:hypothetical protein
VIWLEPIIDWPIAKARREPLEATMRAPAHDRRRRDEEACLADSIDPPARATAVTTGKIEKAD